MSFTAFFLNDKNSLANIFFSIGSSKKHLLQNLNHYCFHSLSMNKCCLYSSLSTRIAHRILFLAEISTLNTSSFLRRTFAVATLFILRLCAALVHERFGYSSKSQFYFQILKFISKLSTFLFRAEFHRKSIA